MSEKHSVTLARSGTSGHTFGFCTKVSLHAKLSLCTKMTPCFSNYNRAIFNL